MEQISAIIIVISSVSKLIYAKVSIQSVLYFSIVVFLSYLVRQFLFVIGIINNFNKKPLHTFFEYAMFIVIISFSLWMLNEVFNITQQEYVWTVTRIFFVGFFAVCVRSHVVSYFKQNATTMGSILLVLILSIGIFILFPTEVISLLFVEVASLLFGLLVRTAHAAGPEMVPGEGTQEGTEQMALVAVNRERWSSEQPLQKARIEQMIRCSPTSDLLRISGTDYNNRRLRELYGKPLCRLRLSNKDFGCMVKNEFLVTTNGRKKIMPVLSVCEMEVKLERRIAGKFEKCITRNELTEWFENNLNTDMPKYSESIVSEHYDNMLFFCPGFWELLYPPRIYYHLPTQNYDTFIDINILLKQVRFNYANNDKLTQFFAETMAEYNDRSVGQRSDLEKELVKSCLESKEGLAFELQTLRRMQDSLHDSRLEPVLKMLICWTGLDEKRDLAIFLAKRIEKAHLRYNHYLTLDLLAVLEEKRFGLRSSEALNALKPEKIVRNGQRIKPEFLTFNRKQFDASKEIKFFRPNIWAPLAQHVQTFNEQGSIKRIETSYQAKTEWHTKNPLPSNPDTMETEGSESSDRDAQTKKRKFPI